MELGCVVHMCVHTCICACVHVCVATKIPVHAPISEPNILVLGMKLKRTIKEFAAICF